MRIREAVGGDFVEAEGSPEFMAWATRVFHETRSEMHAAESRLAVWLAKRRAEHEQEVERAKASARVRELVDELRVLNRKALHSSYRR